jgi:DNA invertase Pin-like site-specific DNA recombinase
MCFSLAAEIERSLISERTKEALRVRKESGVKLGLEIPVKVYHKFL